MATTDFSNLAVAQRVVQAAKVSQAGRDQSFFMSRGFVGKGTDDMSSPIQRITDLTPTERGSAVVMHLVADLQEDGQVGDAMLEGNEEALINDALVITIDLLRHAVRSAGKMSEQKTVLRFRNIAKEQLAFWLANTIDQLCFLTASGVSYEYKCNGATRSGSRLPDLAFAADVAAPTSARKLFAGGVSATTSLTVDDTMTWALIVAARAYAEQENLKPIMNMGKPHYIMVLSTAQMRDLKLDPTYLAISRSAGERGSKNPLFAGADLVVDGVVLYSHNKVFNTLGATSGSGKWGASYTVDGAQALLLGAQAMGMATIGAADWAEKDLDYGNRAGVSYGRMFGLLKPQFKSAANSMTRQDFGVISVYTAAAATATGI